MSLLLSANEKCVLRAFPGDYRDLTANDAGVALENAGLVVGGRPSNRCLPGASVLRALARKKLVWPFRANSGRRFWALSQKGRFVRSQL